jgi:hypothetical protein
MMAFHIADTFTDSFSRLTGEAQKAAKTTAFDLQLKPAQPSMQLHKLDCARDPYLWSVRVSRDIRLILHKTDASLLLCYVDHHDNAYRLAERRKTERHLLYLACTCARDHLLVTSVDPPSKFLDDLRM